MSCRNAGWSSLSGLSISAGGMIRECQRRPVCGGRGILHSLSIGFVTTGVWRAGSMIFMHFHQHWVTEKHYARAKRVLAVIITFNTPFCVYHVLWILTVLYCKQLVPTPFSFWYSSFAFLFDAVLFFPTSFVLYLHPLISSMSMLMYSNILILLDHWYGHGSCHCHELFK